MRKRWIALGVLALVAVTLFVVNASIFAAPTGEMTLLSHRGIYQRFHRAGLTNETCTANRLLPLTHAYLENTLPSMRAAFAAGADMVEIDIHPTTDGDFAVFHDWTVDCRTNGEGETRAHSMAALRTLDIGYRYTADGGRTFPFRGQGIGQMPNLREVLAEFPQRRFLINFKSNDSAEADALLAYLDATPNAELDRLAFYGARPAERMRALRPDLKTTSRAGLIACAKDYMLTGWFGRIGAPCRNTIIFAPANLAWLLWGWPNRFLARMQTVGTEVYIAGPLQRGERLSLNGIDDSETFATVPRDWRGGVATDAIEIIGPLAHPR